MHTIKDHFQRLDRNPTDVELETLAQTWSEHCKHKVFNGIIDYTENGRTERIDNLFAQTIRQATKDIRQAKGDEDWCVSVFVDNAGIIKFDEQYHLVFKVETHNHPTAISPFPGAATGSGGEIRDEGATGTGSKPKAGLCGFSVSNLKIPGFTQPWEKDNGKPDRIASALDIIIEAPIGAASFNNEFGRPNTCGYFRTFELAVDTPHGEEIRGYHKPIMVAGGVGSIRREHIDKKVVPIGANIIVLGGPAMLIGLGGGAASSMTSGSSSENLDFASVQRGNPEMQRRVQEAMRLRGMFQKWETQQTI